MLSKVSVYEVFMRYFKKMSSSSGPRPPPGFQTLDPAGELPSFRPPHCPPLEKIPRASM